MYQNNKPTFGQTAPGSTFGSGGFSSASTTTPFGQSSAFGKPATSGFAAPAFGAVPNSGLFGNTAASTGGLFGAPSATPVFGQAQSAQPSAFGSFQSNQPSSNIFGAQQNASTGLFGASSGTTSAFGASKPTFGGFGTSQASTGLFGQQTQQPQTSSSLFGQPSTQTSAGLFGGTSGFGAVGAAQSSGTTTKFVPLTGTDTMMKNNQTQTISTRHQCITCMKEYENKSLEELRLEDYLANRKGPQQGAQSGGMFGSQPQPSIFGAAGTSTNTSGGMFSDNKPLFGASTNTMGGFGASTSGVFGQPAQPTGGMFGKPTGFGAATTTTASTGFSGGFSQPTSNPFGQTSAVKPFGAVQPQTTNMFGAVTSQPSVGFGTQNTGFSGFGAQPTQSMNLFGANKTTFNQMPATSAGTGFSFGQTAGAANTGSIFGAKPATGTGFGTGFGATPAPAFGATTNMFGQAQPNTSLFNQPFNKPATPGFSFGQTAPTNTSGLGTGLSLGGQGLFGNTAAKPTGSLFGTNTGGMFSSGGFGGGSFAGGQGFGSNLGLGGNQQLGGGLGMMGQVAPQATSPSHQQILALASMPFGDSPLFRNLLPASGRADELLKPTNPVAQKAILSSNQFKVSPRSNMRLKVKPIVPSVLSKKSLFDGMDDNDKRDAEVFTPRTSSRRLLLKPAQPAMPDSTPPPAKPAAAATASLAAVERATSDILDSSATIERDDSWLRAVNTRPAKNMDGGIKSSSSLRHSMLALDNTVGELRGPQHQPRPSAASDTNKENVSLTSNSFDDSVVEEAEPSLIEDQQSHPTGVVLRRVGYYTIPSLDELTSIMGEDGTCVVENFTVGREGYGNVFFPESFDVSGLNLDEIVHFRHKEVTLYPDDDKKPAVGEGLNRRAQVTLDRVWPTDKTTRLPITDPDRLAQMDYEAKLQRACAKLQSRFLEYRPQTGSWVFKVDHFSKYGVDDSDEDELPTIDVKKLKLTLPMQPAAHSTPQASLAKTVQPASSPAPSQTYIVEDEEMEPETQKQTAPMLRLRDHHTDVERADDRSESFHQSPSMQLARDLVSSSHKVQLMKASFFAEDDVHDQDIETVDQFGENEMSNYHAFKISRRDDYFDDDTSSKSDSDNLSSAKLMKSFPVFRTQLASQSPYVPSMRIRVGSSTADFPKQRVQEESAMVDMGPLNGAPKVTQMKFAADENASVSDSAVWKLVMARNKEWPLDAVLLKGSGFKPKWGAGSTLLNLVTKKSSATMALRGSWRELGDFMSGRTKGDESVDYVQRIRISGGEGSSQAFKDSVIGHLSVQLEHSVLGVEHGCPAIGPASGVGALHAHATLASALALELDRDPLASYAAQTWALCAALWGRHPDLMTGAGDAPHHETMVRRKTVSDWLEAAVLPAARKEIAEPRQEDDDHVSEVFSLLSANQVAEACRVAQNHSDHNAAILLAQLRSGARVRGPVETQLAMWRDAEADRFISPDRLKLYMLMAGLPLMDSAHGTLNVCEGLDWKRAFALHLWYLCSPVTSVSDALLRYEDAFGRSDAAQMYAAPPEPPFAPPFRESLAMGANDGEPGYDLCYQLLRLYGCKTHPLDKLLNPTTHGEDPFDYRLSWFLLQTLGALGYAHSSHLSAAVIHTGFANQLESNGLWKWAVFVLLHLKNAQSRRSVVLDVLGRHISLSTDKAYLSEETFLVDRLNVPAQWIFQAKGTLALSLGRYELAALYLIEAGQWNHSHQVIMEHIAPSAVNNESYKALERLLRSLEPAERSGTIAGWANGGQILWDFLAVMAEIKTLLADRDLADGYRLEKLNPQLTSLCARISMFPCHTLKHTMCQAHIANVTASLVQTYLSLQPGGGRHTTQALAHLVVQLPLPSESRQEMVSTVVDSFLGEM